MSKSKILLLVAAALFLVGAVLALRTMAPPELGGPNGHAHTADESESGHVPGDWTRMVYRTLRFAVPPDWEIVGRPEGSLVVGRFDPSAGKGVLFSVGAHDTPCSKLLLEIGRDYEQLPPREVAGWKTDAWLVSGEMAPGMDAATRMYCVNEPTQQDDYYGFMVSVAGEDYETHAATLDRVIDSITVVKEGGSS
jgi:hypothetical protein